MQEPPFVIYDPNSKVYPNDPHNGVYTGIVVEMMDTLAEELQFEYVMSEPWDGKYGSINDETGEANGMVGQLFNCVSRRIVSLFACGKSFLQNLDACIVKGVA